MSVPQRSCGLDIKWRWWILHLGEMKCREKKDITESNPGEGKDQDKTDCGCWEWMSVFHPDSSLRTVCVDGRRLQQEAFSGCLSGEWTKEWWGAVMRRHQQMSKAGRMLLCPLQPFTLCWGQHVPGKVLPWFLLGTNVYPHPSLPHVSAEVREHPLPKKGQVSAFPVTSPWEEAIYLIFMFGES